MKEHHTVYFRQEQKLQFEVPQFTN